MEQLDLLRTQITGTENEQTTQDEMIVGAATTSGVTVIAGVVSYILRGGSLLASFMSSLPLWNGFDPLPILNTDKSKTPIAKKGKGDEKNKKNDDVQEKNIKDILGK
jgi:hypothetical protein